MTEINYIIQHEMGLHARPAGQLVKLLMDFVCDIQLGTRDKMVDAKRMIGVMSLALPKGTPLVLTFDGPDEDMAAQAAQEFLTNNL